MNRRSTRRSFCTSVFAGCSVPLWTHAQPTAPLEIGVLPNLSARVLMAQYQPMRDYLTREMNRPIQVSTAPDWPAFHQRTLALEYDLIVTAPNLARLAQLDRGFVPILSYSPNIRGMVVSASAKPLTSIAGIRRQTLVLSNPQSLVTLRGMEWLAENGLHRDRDFKTIRVPTDDSVGNVVIRGDACAAMLSGGEYRSIPEPVKAQLKILTTFAEVPGFVVMANPRLAPAEVRGIKANLLGFAADAHEGKAFFSSSGFTGIQEPAPGLMESLDRYVEATRALMKPAA